MTRLLLAGAVAAACASCGGPPPAPPGTIVVALANSPVNLDPAVGLDEASQKLHQLLYSSLMKVDGELRVVPDLATRFDTTDSQTYIVEIPRGVWFHDGREMAAADVAFTYRRFLDPKFSSGRKGAYRDLASVDAVGSHTVAFRLKAPSASFPINLVMGIVPEGTGADAARRPIGSGPYRLASFAPDDHVLLTAFDKYYRGPARNDGLLFKVVPDATMRALELRKGTVDLVVNELVPDVVHGLRRDGGLGVHEGPGTDYAYLAFNFRDSRLRDVRVRHAIGHAIDTGAIVHHLRRGLARPATGIVPPMSWAYEPDVVRFDYDPDRARALLDEAGLGDRDGPGPAPRLRLTLTTSTDERARLQAAVIQQQLAEVGIAVEVRSFEFQTMLQDVVRGNTQLYTLQYVGVTDPDMLRRAFHSAQIPPNGFNRGHYVNPELDQVIDAATSALDPNERLRLYKAAQRIVAADAPYISLWVMTNIAVAQAGISGVTLSPIADFGFMRELQKRN
jgi:peptide/nickel transport system substrate-binding protein